MNIVNFLFAYPAVNDLSSLSRLIKQALGDIEFEERESSNYVDGRYFSGHIGSITVVLALSDETDHDDLTYWIAFKSDEVAEEELITLTDAIMKEKLLPLNFKIARFESFGRVDERRIND
jgi:hypothetical protein